jgi:RHS repeat-associated protein
VKARILSTSQARADGVGEFALELTSTTADSAGPVAVQIPKKLLSGLYGADFTSRIEWVQSTPPVASDFSVGASKSSSTAPVTPTVVPASVNKTSGDLVVMPQVSDRTLVLQAMSTPVSTTGTGSFAATPLDAASTWDVSAQTGDLSWSLPMRTPPAAAGPAAQLSLNYDSQSIDGETGATNNQPSNIGDGWSLGGAGYIQRQYVSCSKDTGASGPVTSSGDLCWLTNNAILSLGSHSGNLVEIGTTTSWRLQNDDGTRVQELSGTSGCTNNDNDNECWRVTTTDGTQYYFGLNHLPGWATGKATTNSTWTVPVFGNDVGEPCHASTFATSECLQAWRWNLDYVVDTHANAEAIYYYAETNKYALRGGTATSYTRGGAISSIQYGIPNGAITGGNAYATNAASDKVVFTYAPNGRCSATSGCTPEPMTSAAVMPTTPSLYPDVPWDEYCTASTCAGKLSPTFWSDAELSSVSTQAWVASASAYKPVDTWTLGHSFPAPGDGTNAALWLTQVTHQGTDSTTSEPPTVFTGVAMQNRVWAVDGLAPLDKYRLSSIQTSLGAIVSVNYLPQQCTPADVATIEANAQSNTERCFPQWWSPSVVPPQPEQEDLFHKYVVSSVISNPETGGPNDESQETYYDYSPGLPAWRYDTSPFTPPSERTWNVYAGYDKVRVTTGSPSSPSSQQSILYTFFQGLDGDRAGPSGGTKTVYVDGSSTLKDSLWFGGMTREAVVYNGSASTAATISDTVTTPWASTATAVPPSGPSAYMTGNQEVLKTEDPLGAGIRSTDTTTTFDPTYGIPTQIDTESTDAGSTCETTTYAAPNTTAWIIGLPAEMSTVGVKCADLPTATYPAAAISDVRTTYDGGTVGSMPTKGSATKTEVVDSYSGSTAATAHWVTSSQTTFDVMGRPLQVTDVLGRTTTTAYTPAASGPLTSTISTNTAPFNWTTTTVYDPRWGVETSATDANGAITTAQYDGLGRRTGVWLPDHTVIAFPTEPSTAFVYSERGNAANSVESITAAPTSLVASWALYDGLGRQVQTQAPAEGSGSTVQDTMYNSEGQVYLADNPYWTTSAASSTLFVPSSLADIPSQTETLYDGDGRTTASILNTFGAERSRTSYAYPGPAETDTTPPTGGTPTSTFENSRGQTTELIQYLAASPSPTSTQETTAYGYDAQGSMTSMTDSAGDSWSWSYDVLGDQTSAVDPDTGKTQMSYDDAGRLLTSTDARNITLAFSYDNLDREIGEYQNSTGPSGIPLDSWTYDSLKKGKLSSSTAYSGSTAGTKGLAYTDTVFGYDANYRPTGDTVSIPTGAPAFGGTSYLTRYGYAQGGEVSGIAYPAEGGLAAENLKSSYDGLGNLSTLTGTANYARVLYSPIGQVTELDRTGTNEMATSFGYDPATGSMNDIEDTTLVGTTSSLLQNSAYTYDPAGNVTSIATTSASLPADTQCFSYDYLRNLTEAWTPADSNCAGAPSSGNLGGAAPYWTSYSVDPATGNRVSTTEHGTTPGADSTTDTYSYPAPGSGAHAVQSISHVTGGVTTTPSTYSYDASGNTIARPGQTLSYDAEGKISTVTEGSDSQSNVYDSSGNLLLQTDSTIGTTLYLGATQLHLAAGASTPSAVRTYSVDGVPVAEQSTVAGVSGSTVTWLGADAQSTVDLQMNVSTGSVAERLQDPFGQARGGSPTTWSDGHGFLNAATDALSGLAQLGARMYDASIGRFLSVDSVLSPSDPQQNNGYSYAHNSPIDMGDPSGLNGGCISSVCNDSVQPPNTGKGSTSDLSGAAGNGTGKGSGNDKESGVSIWSGFQSEVNFDVDVAEGFFGSLGQTVGAIAQQSAPYWIFQAVLKGPAAAIQSYNNIQFKNSLALNVLFDEFQKDPGGTTLSVLGGFVDAKDWEKHPGRSAGTGLFTAGTFALSATGIGEVADAQRSDTIVIGAMEDLEKPNAIGPGERTLLPQLAKKLPNSNAYWARNEMVLFKAMLRGKPIRDATHGADGALAQVGSGRFIEDERGLLTEMGWEYDKSTTLWMPPAGW